MTEPRSGPLDDSGLPGGSGPSGSGPPADMSSGTTGQGDKGQGDMGQQHEGPGSTGATSIGGPGQEAGGGATPGESAGTEGGGVKTRTSAPQATIPQQYGPPTERAGMETEATVIAGAGDRMIAAAAGRAWPGVLFGGLGMLALGVMLLVWPAASLTIGAILIGAAVLVSGVVKLFEGFTASNLSGGMRAGYIAIGLLAVLAGCYLLVHHAFSLFLLAFVAGVYFIAHGVTELGVGISGHVPARAARIVLGIFSIAAGIVMVVWPAISLTLLLTVAAAFLLFYGLVLCGLAYSLNKASKGGTAGAERHAPSFTRKKKLAASAR
jgi:uncharacterized membrane protein HdeD (DUF308 family)